MIIVFIRKGVFMEIGKIQNNKKSNSILTFSGGGHHPRRFSSLMNYLYKKTIAQNPDMFESINTISISTKLDNGKDITGTANFSNGQYIGLTLDKKNKALKTKFIQTILDKYINKISSKSVKEKIARNKQNELKRSF